MLNTAGSTGAYCFPENVKTWDFNKIVIFLMNVINLCSIVSIKRYQSISFSAFLLFLNFLEHFIS